MTIKRFTSILFFLTLLSAVAITATSAGAASTSGAVSASSTSETYKYGGTLRISEKALVMAAKYRSNKGKYQPRREGSSLDRKLGSHPMPRGAVRFLLHEVWKAFGYEGKALDRRVDKNFAQVSLESGGKPYIIQGRIGDVNENNPARGLFQFIPSTFRWWNVAGFDDVFNPLDNILATVNAQVNGPMPVLDGSSGWSPPRSKNPYDSPGKVQIVR